MIANIVLALGFTSYFTQYPMIAAIHVIWLVFVGTLLTMALIALCSKQVRNELKKEMSKDKKGIQQTKAVIYLVMFFATGHVVLGVMWFAICGICLELEKACKTKK